MGVLSDIIMLCISRFACMLLSSFCILHGKRCSLLQVTLPAKDPWTVETGHSVKASVTGSAATPVPTVVSCVTDHGLSLLQLTSSLGYDWAARMLFRHVADINLQVSAGTLVSHVHIISKVSQN